MIFPETETSHFVDKDSTYIFYNILGYLQWPRISWPEDRREITHLRENE